MKKLNLIFKWVLYLAIVRHAIGIPQQLMKISSGIYDNSICYVAIIVNIVMIAILSNILRIKKYALSFFFIFQYINALLIGIIEQRGDYLTPFVISTILSSIMAGLLFLKKDGISGWQLFYSSTTKNCNRQQEQMESKMDKEPITNSSTNPVSHSKQSIIEIPKKEDGTIDYDSMTIKQQFEYTSSTESVAVACQDLKKEISRRKKEIKKLEKRLPSCTGGKLAELRDIIRTKKTEVQEVENLIPISYKKTIIRKIRVKIVTCAVLVIIALGALYIAYNNNQREEAIAEEIAAYRLSVYNDMKEEGYEGSYDDYMKHRTLPLRKFAIYSFLNYKNTKNISYDDFVLKLGFDKSDLIQETYELLQENGINIEKIDIDNFHIWIKEKENYNFVYQALNKHTNLYLEGLGEELEIQAINKNRK